MLKPTDNSQSVGLNTRFLAQIITVFRSIAGSILLTTTGYLNAAMATETDPNDHIKELKIVRSRIEKLQKSVGELENERNSIIAQLKNLDEQNGKIAETIKAFKRSITVKRKRANEINRRLTKLTSEVAKYKAILAKQMRASYKMGEQDRLKIVLNQDDPNRINRLLVYYEYFNRQNIRQLSAFQEKISVYHNVKDDHLRTSNELGVIVKNQHSEQQHLEKVRKARNQILKNLDHDLKLKGKHLSELLENERKLEQLIASIQKIMSEFPVEDERPFQSAIGALEWPTEGKLVRKFGSKRLNGRWEGVLIQTTEGSPVNAVARGRVAYSDWLRGYGLIIIIDHGDQFMTLYAFNESLYKDVGDWVESGETIASVGRSGGQLEPGLYFEIRQNGKPVNPIKWCKDPRGQRVEYHYQENLLYIARESPRFLPHRNQ